MITTSRLALLVTSGAAVASVLTACGSSGNGSSGGGATGGTTAAGSSGASSSDMSSMPDMTSSAPAAAGGGSAAASGSTTSVGLSEFKITMGATTMKAGTHTFDVKNTGTITHALTIDGPGVEDRSTGDMSPGDTKTLTVTLKAGKYDFYCPVGDHKMEGMDETVTVS